MNIADSDRLASALDQLGLKAVESRENADVVVLNTRSLSGKKNILREVKFG